jgi:hypothetical protein
MSLPRSKQHTILNPFSAERAGEIDANFDAICQDLLLLAQRFRWGAGSPEGIVDAPAGTVYLRTDGGTNLTLYVKETGASSVGWVAK